MPVVKTRFAPSPTGLIHFGNVRTALFNALYARKHQGVFLLRIEDTDAERSRDDYVRQLEADLRWLGLEWHEGEDRDLGHGPYRQSQRTDVYQRYLQILEQRQAVYPCFCTPLELEVSRKTQAASGLPPKYSGKCAHLKPDEAAHKLALGTPHTLRFRMQKNVEIGFDDMVRGEQHFSPDDIGDFIVRRSDGSFAFFFVNAVDDALMEVSHVLRGEDHLTNTPRQIAILKALELPIPKYGHISLIVNRNGAPLSKRTGSLSVQELRELGYFSQAILNYLARLGHHYADSSLLTLDALASQFAEEHLGRAPARYDASQLDHWQALTVQQADTQTLRAWLAPVISGRVPEESQADFVEAIRANIVSRSDAALWIDVIYSDTPPLAADARQVLENTNAAFFRAAAETLSADMDFQTFAARVKAATGQQGKQLFLPLRAALTGQTHGPEMPRVFRLMGFERAQHRLSEHILSTDFD